MYKYVYEINKLIIVFAALNDRENFHESLINELILL